MAPKNKPLMALIISKLSFILKTFLYNCIMKNNGWVNALFALFFLVVPGIILIFLIFDLNGIDNNLLVQAGVGIAFIVYGVLLSILVILIKWIAIESLAFNIPITIVFGLLMITNEGPIWLMAIMTFVAIMTALPANGLVQKLKRRKK